jgi:hypothetical protein
MEEEKNKNLNTEDIDNLLQESYEIDNESFEDSEVEVSKSRITLRFSSASEEMDNFKIFLDFIQAIKDDNSKYVKEFMDEHEGNAKCKLSKI